MIDIDLSDDLLVHARSMARRIGTVEAETDRSVTKEALELARDWRAEAAGHRNLPYLPAAVRVDDVPDGKRVSFGDGSQGTLAHIAAFGSYRSAPVMDVFTHVRDARESLAQWAARIGADL